MKEILKRLGSLETTLAAFKDETGEQLGQVRECLAALETRAGVIYSGD